jgi:hypothetical protein
MKMRLPVMVLILVSLSACGGDGSENGTTATSTTEAQPACPPAGGGQLSGETSEGLCVTLAVDDAPGEISVFEIEILATCSAGFGESEFVLGSDTETVTTTEAPSDPGQEFEATVEAKTPIEVQADGSFESGNLSGTVTDDQAEGSYELAFSSEFPEISCSGGPVTWTASTGS